MFDAHRGEALYVRIKRLLMDKEQILTTYDVAHTRRAGKKKIQNGGSAPFLFIDLFNKGLMKTYINIP
jgi:hypothetical protein